MALATLNNVSALDTIAGPYAPAWSQTNWSCQTLVSAAQTAATGGTYALHAPVAESAPVEEAKVEAPKVRKPRAKKAVSKPEVKAPAKDTEE